MNSLGRLAMSAARYADAFPPCRPRPPQHRRCPHVDLLGPALSSLLARLQRCDAAIPPGLQTRMPYALLCYTHQVQRCSRRSCRHSAESSPGVLRYTVSPHQKPCGTSGRTLNAHAPCPIRYTQPSKWVSDLIGQSVPSSKRDAARDLSLQCVGS